MNKLTLRANLSEVKRLMQSTLIFSLLNLNLKFEDFENIYHKQNIEAAGLTGCI